MDDHTAGELFAAYSILDLALAALTAVRNPTPEVRRLRDTVRDAQWAAWAVLPPGRVYNQAVGAYVGAAEDRAFKQRYAAALRTANVIQAGDLILSHVGDA